jgi:hypothetical protein
VTSLSGSRGNLPRRRIPCHNPTKEPPVPTGQVVPLAHPEPQQLAAAAAAFLAQPSLAASTRRSYQQTLGRLERKLGAAQLL